MKIGVSGRTAKMRSSTQSFHEFSMETYRVGLRLVVLLYSVQILQSSPWTASIIVFRCKQIVTHYRNHYVNSAYKIDSDPLNFFEDDEKEILCNAVIGANQYTYEQDIRSKNTLLTAPDEQHSSKSKLETCPLRVGGYRRKIRCLRCARTTVVKWFVAFGKENSYMYLLEPGVGNVEPNFKLTGLIESRANVNKDRSFLQFHSQFRKSHKAMEKICKLKVEDRLRVCSVLFEALNAGGMQHMNTLQAPRVCAHSFIRGKTLEVKANLLPCKLVTTSTRPWLRKFFVLSDPSEQGAAFVFIYANIKQGRYQVLELYTRATGISALVYPIGPYREKKEKAKPPADLSQVPIRRGKRSRHPSTPPSDPSTSDTDYFDSTPLKEFIEFAQSKRARTQRKEESPPFVHPHSSREYLVDPEAHMDESVQWPISTRTRSRRKWELEHSVDTPEELSPEPKGKQVASEFDSEPMTEDEERDYKSDFEMTSSE